MALSEFNVTAVVASAIDLHRPEDVASVLDALAGSWPAVAGADEIYALGCLEIRVTIAADSFRAAILRAQELLSPIGPVIAFDVMTAQRYDERFGFGVPAQPSGRPIPEQAAPAVLPVQAADQLADATR